ncbi:hypothetical protein FOYG_17140 [Fusarium oxysporum NRRL 32931]|uniref:Uncharacterized protein n=1 Tax=Fusarium oxysporum NRRL 32931 TaxID=660029 RepID=W9HHS4_FUSOX|nr:hypothetical protein FOYG_17140 [Fusarium oxysporum NRRL 32931]
MPEMGQSKTHQPCSGTAETNKDNLTSPSKRKSKDVEPQPLPFIGIMTVSALAAAFGALLYFIRATNFAIFGADLSLLWGEVPVECVVWSAAILLLAWRDVRGLMKD